MDKKIVCKYLVYTLGSFIMGVGIGICEQANLGVDPMSVLVLGLNDIFHLTFGMMNAILSIILVVIGYLCEKKNVTFATFIALISVSVGIDFYGLFQFSYWNLPYSLILLAIGILVYAFGIALSQVASCGYTAYDCVIFGMMRITKQKYNVIRWIVDGSYALLGYLFGGPVGICTIAIAVCSGSIIMYFNQKLSEKIKFK